MAPPLFDSKDGMLLYRELLRRFPLAQVEDYYKHGRWLTKHLETDLELVLAHRREAAAPEPVPLEKIPVPQLPEISRPPSHQGRSVPPSKPPAASTLRSTAANGPWTSRSKQYSGKAPSFKRPRSGALPTGAPLAGASACSQAPSFKRPRNGALPIGAPLAARTAKARAEEAPAPAARPGVLLPMKGKARPPMQRAQPQPKPAPAPAQHRSAASAPKPAAASAEKAQKKPAPKLAPALTAKSKPQPVPTQGRWSLAPAPKAAVGAPPQQPAVGASAPAADAAPRRPGVGAASAADAGAMPATAIAGAAARCRPLARAPDQPASDRPAPAAPQLRQVIGGVAPRRAPTLSTPGDLIKTLLR